jgi:integrase
LTSLNVLTIVLTRYAYPCERWPQSKPVLDLLLHGVRWPTPKEIHEANRSQKSVGSLSRSGTRRKHCTTGNVYRGACAGRAKLNIAAITPKDILGFRKTRSARGLASSTVNLDVKIIGAAFNAAKRQGYIPMNPCAAIEPLPFEKPEKHVFDAKHVRALMAAAVMRERGRLIFEAGEDWRGAILFAFYTGARLQDVANMRWESIDLPNKLISYAPRKTRGRVVVPIHPELETHLLNLPTSDSGKAFVFPKLVGNETGGRSGLSRTFARIMARAKIEGEVARKANKQGRTVRTLTFHSLRHSFSSAMANAGVAEELRMKLTGHATREVHAKYTHHELAPLRAAIEVLPSIGAK